MSVRRGIIGCINVHNIYIKERCYFFLVCTLRKAIKNFEVKVCLQKNDPQFRDFF